MFHKATFHKVMTLFKIMAVTFFLVFSSSLPGWCQQALTARQAREIRTFRVSRAEQAVAVDESCFYIINSSSITKHSKQDGAQLARWEDTGGVVKHLNSGVILDGKLYCAHSNYPESPMAGSIEIFDAATLQHIDNHSFGIGHGSVTWIDRRDGYWWVGFANYSGNRSSEGRDTRWTCLVKYSKEWQEVGSWIFPKDVIASFTPMSNSGGAWGKDGLLYCTGHDKPEIYVMKLPEAGYTLQHVSTIPVTMYGQGIAIDRSVKDKLLIYGLSRASSTIILSEIE